MPLNMSQSFKDRMKELAVATEEWLVTAYPEDYKKKGATRSIRAEAPANSNENNDKGDTMSKFKVGDEVEWAVAEVYNGQMFSRRKSGTVVQYYSGDETYKIQPDAEILGARILRKSND